jgi:tetratricopeptide (TPR) repeat protein
LLLLLLVPLSVRAGVLPGIGYYERGEYERARRVLTEELNDTRLSDKDRARVRVYLAASLYSLGLTKEALQRLEEVARNFPEQRVDPALFPPELVTLERQARENVASEQEKARQAERERIAAEAERLKREAEARQPPPVSEEPARVATPWRLRPEATGFVEAVEKQWGLGAGLTVGGGALEGSARLLIGDNLGAQLEAGYLFGEGAFQPRVGLRGTLVPGLDGSMAFGGGAVVGGRLALSPRFTALLDVGAEYFSAPSGYQDVVVVVSAGLGFNLLSP